MNFCSSYSVLVLIAFLLSACVGSTESSSSSSSNPPSTSSSTDTASDQNSPSDSQPTIPSISVTPTSTVTPTSRPTSTPTSGPTTTPTIGPTSTPTPTPTMTPSPTPTVPSSSVLTGSAVLDSEEWAFVTLINDYRAQKGLAKLQVSITLTQASDWLSTDMATKNYFDHTDSQNRNPFTRMADFGYKNSSSSGENIAAGNSTAQATFTQWKNSPGHNANMLGSSYKVIGVGRANSSKSSYGWYWTTDFGSTVDATVQ